MIAIYSYGQAYVGGIVVVFKQTLALVIMSFIAADTILNSGMPISVTIPL